MFAQVSLHRVVVQQGVVDIEQDNEAGGRTHADFRAQSTTMLLQ
ncbi:MAG: hypothetical protein ACLQFF_09600 [Steroidobacteraceae bacterium]|jgi:hypothetical protein